MYFCNIAFKNNGIIYVDDKMTKQKNCEMLMHTKYNKSKNN